MNEEGWKPDINYRHQNTPQPHPHPQPQTTHPRQAAHWLACADLLERAAMGQQKYGVPLVVENGRDHLVDAYQELLDLLVYLRMELERRVRVPGIALEEMGTILSASGWVVQAPDRPFDRRLWETIGRTEGYLPTAEDLILPREDRP